MCFQGHVFTNFVDPTKLDKTLFFQGRVFTSEVGGVKGGWADARNQDHRQESSSGQRRFLGERNQGAEKVKSYSQQLL